MAQRRKSKVRPMATNCSLVRDIYLLKQDAWAKQVCFPQTQVRCYSFLDFLFFQRTLQLLRPRIPNCIISSLHIHFSKLKRQTAYNSKSTAQPNQRKGMQYPLHLLFSSLGKLYSVRKVFLESPFKQRLSRKTAVSLKHVISQVNSASKFSPTILMHSLHFPAFLHGISSKILFLIHTQP